MSIGAVDADQRPSGSAGPDAPGTPDAPARPARWTLRRVLGDHLPLTLLLAGYLVARVVILTRFTVFTSPDAGSYAPRPGVSDQIEVLSFTGHAPRPWGVPLLYAAVGTDQARAVLQWGISTVAWALLVWACWRHLRSLPARLAAGSALVGLALARSVYTWDHAILSESLSISLGVAALALLATWARTRSRVALAGTVAVAFWWTFTRPDVLPYVVLLALVLLGYVCVRGRRLASLVAAVVLVAGLGWHAAIVPTVDHAYRSWGTGLSLSEATFLYRLRFQVLNDPEVSAVYQDRFGMPSCPRAEQIANGDFWAMGAFIQAYRDCPELVTWVDREKDSVGWRYALADPGHYRENVVDLLPTSLGGTAGRYAAPVAGVPAFPEQVFFPDRDRVLPLAGGALLLALLVGLVGRAFRRARWLAATGVLLALGSTGAAVAGMMYSAGEYSRFGIQEAVLLRVGLILALAAAVDSLFARGPAVAAPTGGVGEPAGSSSTDADATTGAPPAEGGTAAGTPPAAGDAAPAGDPTPPEQRDAVSPDGTAPAAPVSASGDPERR